MYGTVDFDMPYLFTSLELSRVKNSRICTSGRLWETFSTAIDTQSHLIFAFKAITSSNDLHYRETPVRVRRTPKLRLTTASHIQDDLRQYRSAVLAKRRRSLLGRNHKSSREAPKDLFKDGRQAVRLKMLRHGSIAFC